MMPTTPLKRTHAPAPRPSLKAAGTKIFLLLLLLTGLSAAARAQGAKLPPPDKIVGEYVKALGGKRGVASLRAATYDWAVTRDGRLSTLTDREAFAARLQALLESAHFADYKKQKVLARTVGREEVAGTPAYVVEFATRAGARLRYWFGEKSRLLLQSEDEARRTRVRFADWRARAGSPLKVEPHRVEVERAGEPVLTLTLVSAGYNTGLAESFFEPPADATLDIPALLRDLSKNQEETDKRINDYTFTRK